MNTLKTINQINKVRAIDPIRAISQIQSIKPIKRLHEATDTVTSSLTLDKSSRALDNTTGLSLKKDPEKSRFSILSKSSQLGS